MVNKFMTGVLVSGFLAMTAPASVLAQDNTIRLDLGGAKPQEKPSIIYVDTSDVIVLDVSSSMDFEEISAAFQGAKDYYLSERNISNYRMGICAQSTVFYFAKDYFMGPSAIICSEKDARAFSNSIIAEDLNYIKSVVNSGFTNTGEGLYAAVNFFEQQQTKGEVSAIQRRVVLIGDEFQAGSEAPVIRASNELVKKFNAQIFGIAIGSRDVQARFNRFMVSDSDNFPSALALRPLGVSNNLNEFLRFTNG